MKHEIKRSNSLDYCQLEMCSSEPTLQNDNMSKTINAESWTNLNNLKKLQMFKLDESEQPREAPYPGLASVPEN